MFYFTASEGPHEAVRQRLTPSRPSSGENCTSGWKCLQSGRKLGPLAAGGESLDQAV